MAPSDFLPLPDRVALLSHYKGVSLDEVPTPALVIDSCKVSSNCARMHKIAREWGCLFRAHIKTHKTREGVLAQVRDGERGDTPLIVSTLAEAWGVLKSGLVEDAGIKDILYGMPVGVHKISEILELREEIARRGGSTADIKVIIDNIAQFDALQKVLEARDARPVKAFVKIECGYRRAGLGAQSPALADLLEAVITSSHVSLWGLYCHAGHSYGSKSEADAQGFLTLEVESINEAAQVAESILKKEEAHLSKHRSPLILSVGATPTAHAARSAPSRQELQKLKTILHGELELHAGNYPFLDLQQMATHALGQSEHASQMTIHDCALSLIATVISQYPGRKGTPNGNTIATSSTIASQGDEVMIDAGGIALSKDKGQFEGHGHVVAPAGKIGWMVSSVSQEHGVMGIRPGTPDRWAKEWGLEHLENRKETEQLQVGDRVRIIPQHACMTAAAHHWFYVIDSSLNEQKPTIQDIWVPWKSW